MNVLQFLELHMVYDIASCTGLAPARVARMYRAGRPWPLGLPKGLTIQWLDAVECGRDPLGEYRALMPLFEHCEASRAGEDPDDGDDSRWLDRLTDPEPSADPLIEHAALVALKTGEDLQTVLDLYRAMLTYLHPLFEEMLQETNRGGTRT